MRVFGERLKNLRLSKGLTAQQLANELNLTDACILVCEKGHYAVNIKTLISIAKYFNVSIDYLLGLKGKSKK